MCSVSQTLFFKVDFQGPTREKQPLNLFHITGTNRQACVYSLAVGPQLHQKALSLLHAAGWCWALSSGLFAQTVPNKARITCRTTPVEACGCVSAGSMWFLTSTRASST